MQLSPSLQIIIIFPTHSPDYCITCGRCSSPTQKQTTKPFLSVEFHPLLVANISFHSSEISGSFVINNNKWKLELKWKKISVQITIVSEDQTFLNLKSLSFTLHFLLVSVLRNKSASP